jgi:hypothetical protein
MELNFEQKLSPMDLRVFQLSRINKFIKKMDKIGMSCPIMYRKKQFRKIKQSCKFDSYSLSIQQVQERKNYNDKNVIPFSLKLSH